MRTRIFLGAAVGAVLLLVTAAPAHALSGRMAARQLAKAINEGDLGAISAMLADNVVFVGCTGPGTVCTGKEEALKKGFGHDIETGAHVEIDDVSGSDTAFSGTFQYWNSETRAAGVDRVIGEFEGEMENDLITRFAVSFDGSDPQTAKFLRAGQAAGGPSRLPATGDGSLAGDGYPWAWPLAAALLLVVGGLSVGRRQRT